MRDFPLLSLILFLPFMGVFLVWLGRNLRWTRRLALATVAVDLLLALLLLAGFEPAQTGFQFVEEGAWIPTLNIHYRVGVDGISILFIPLSMLLFAGVILASWTAVQVLPQLYYAFLLLLLGSTLGIFLALDTLLFYLFWELTLLPLYFLISLWGIGPNRRYAAVKYVLLMLVGGVPLLFAFLLLAFHHANPAAGSVGLVFDLNELLRVPLSPSQQTSVFFLLLLGFAVKAPVVPFHTWLPVVAMEGPAAVVALVTGLKLGAYGLLRFAIPLAPVAAQTFHWLLAGLGVVGIFYGALAALSQTNLRRMLAFSSLNHVGLVILGIAAFNLQGVQGALLQLLNFTLTAGGLFLLTGLLHHRIGSTDVIHLGGVFRTMPLLTAFFFLLGLASLGIPGTSGFPAEHLLLIGALQKHTGSGLAALAGMVLGAAYFLTFYRRAFLGPVRNPVVAETLDLTRHELALMMVFSILVFLVGFAPRLVLEMIGPATEHWVGQLVPP
ncbi:MAG: NADH-quinone oxidoreductase subunit M [Pseudomonadota bacterium]